MIVRFVTHGNLFLLNPAPQFAVCVLAMGSIPRPSVILEDAPHLVEQAVHRQDGGGQREAILPLQEDLRMSVTLFRRLTQPEDGLFPILGNGLTLPVQLAQQILGVGVSCLC